jgi:hypothetical protein
MSPVTVLTNPDGFFARASDEPSLVPPTLVVLTAGLFGAIASVPALRAVQRGLPPEAQGFSSILLVFGVVGGFVGTVAVWVLLTVAFHVVSAIGFDGEGGFKRLLAFVGWGHVPAIFSAAVGALVNFYVFGGRSVPSDPQRVQAYVQQLRNQPEFLVAGLVGLAFLGWQAFIWTFAVKYARDVTLREAAITVAVPVGIYAAWQLYNLM